MITETATNVHDIEETSKFIRADDGVVYGNSRYSGADKWKKICIDVHLSKGGISHQQTTIQYQGS